MQKTRLLQVLLLVGAAIAVAGCSPSTFVRTTDVGWKTIEFRPDLDKDQAWQRIADTIAKNYDMEVIDRDSGYIRTGWMYTLSGKVTDNYRTRVITNIPLENDRVEMKTDAHWFNPWSEQWVVGYDTALLNQVYTDLQGRVGRVTR